MDALTHVPQPLYALGHRCAVAPMRVSEATCQMAGVAYARRFFPVLGGCHEYLVLASLPPIPARFAAPDDGARP